MNNLRKNIALFVSLVMVLILAMPYSSSIVLASETKDFEFYLVTEVQDYGQRVTGVVIDAQSNVDSSTIDLDTFEVFSNITDPTDDSVYFEGERTITDIYLSDSIEVGSSTEEGQYIVLELDTENGAETFTGTTFYTQEYSITQKSEYAVGGIDVSTDSSYTQADTINDIVDDFRLGKTYTDEDITINSRYYDPSEEYEAPEDGFPLILFLHGGGETGTDNNLQLIANQGATVWVQEDHLNENPTYVLAPQTSSSWSTETAASLVMQMLEDFVAEHNVDPDRIYIQGMSMGSFGTWEMLLRYPDYFAAAIPICGGTTDEWLANDEAWANLKNVPIWVACAQDDFTYEGVENAVAALRAGGTKSLKYYQYNPDSVPIYAHLSWVLVYNDYEIYTWLFEQDKGRTENGTISPKTLFTQHQYNDEITVIYDYDVDPMYVIEKEDKVILIDTGMSSGSLYEYLVNEVLENKDIPIEIYIPHRHADHIYGLPSFIGQDQLKAVYVHELDAEPVENILKGDSNKVVYVDDGDTIPIGDEEIQIITVFGHSVGHTVGLYKDILFSSDAIGSGYVWMFTNPIDAYVDQLQHLNDVVDGMSLTILPGHAQYPGFLQGTMTDQYVRDILECAKGIVDGSITGRLYERSTAGSMIGTYGTASIVYYPTSIYTKTINNFDLYTEVFEYGQNTAAIVIDAGKDVDASSIALDTFSVNAYNTSPLDDSVEYDGEREVVNAYVSKTAEVGESAESGQYIVLELKCGYTIEGATSLIYSGSRNYQLNIDFTVTQLKDYVYADGSAAEINRLAYSQQEIRNLVVDDFEYIEFNGTMIRQYAPVSTEMLPLVLWNHGGGETYSELGNTNEGVQLMANMGGIAWVQDEYPCYVLAPQRGNDEYSRQDVINYIDSLVAAGKVDPNRIYVVGCSAGGAETVNFMYEYPDYFAAAMPICAAVYDITAEEAETVKDIPMWFFHSLDDASVGVEYTQYMVEMLKSVDAKEVKYTEFENMPYSEYGTDGTYQGHWSWIPPLNNYYSEEYGINVFDWLFSKTLYTEPINPSEPESSAPSSVGDPSSTTDPSSASDSSNQSNVNSASTTDVRSTTGKSGTPSTGDYSPYIILIALICIAGIIVVVRKKRI